MSVLKAKPSFGSKLNNPAYYEAVNSIIAVLRPVSTLRTIALHLNNAGFSTPTGLPFNRQRVMNFIRTTNTISKD